MLDALETVLASAAQDRPGVRLHGDAALARLLRSAGAIGRIASAAVGRDAHPVRAVLFDKTPGANWALGWHQDRTIAVGARRDLPGWGPWSIKAGVQHVEPPFAFIDRMVTLRIHLDPVPADNAPLLIAPGSHKLGRVREPEIEKAIARCGAATCLAERGDIWAYATPILHASAISTGHAHRRVLQVDYSADALPAPLEWFGI